MGALTKAHSATFAGLAGGEDRRGGHRRGTLLLTPRRLNNLGMLTIIIAGSHGDGEQCRVDILRTSAVLLECNLSHR